MNAGDRRPTYPCGYFSTYCIRDKLAKNLRQNRSRVYDFARDRDALTQRSLIFFRNFGARSVDSEFKYFSRKRRFFQVGHNFYK
ncbi:hypothetical protein TcasGA2_TC013207 [Tribolium castaneum]|uniref:Uncharacterized protein n=1 Tax=Tribolium castaneum TaxID=7070 RepID=D6WMW5_TRICA|nr:hypothetical protein TcasGA2_TC013207 [Tribolium castaneum]